MDLSKPLLRAWGLLVGLSLLAALATIAAMPRWMAAAVILTLAFWKARIILARYLDLRRAPVWLAGATMALAIWTLLAFALYLLPALAP